MKQQFVDQILMHMSESLELSQLGQLRHVLYAALENYDISTRCCDVATNDSTAEEHLKMYLASLMISGRSQKTVAAYQYHLRHMIQYMNRPLSMITTEDLFTYLSLYKLKHRSSNTYMKLKQTVIHGFFAWFVKKRLLPSNPAEGLDSIKIEKKIRKPLSLEEMERLRSSCDLLDRAIIETLYSTGMRVGELIQLNRDSISWASGECVVLGKGNKERMVYMSDTGMYHLRKYLASRTDSNPALFVSSRNPHGRLDDRQIRRHLASVAAAAGVDHVYPHRIRHTTATNALNRGMPVQELQQLLGHESLDTTMIYAEVAPYSVRNSCRKFLSA